MMSLKWKLKSLHLVKAKDNTTVGILRLTKPHFMLSLGGQVGDVGMNLSF